MAGRTLYLHIGNHAAGDAAIRAALDQQHEALQAAGLQHHDAPPHRAGKDFSDWLEPGLPDADGVSGRRIRQPAELAASLAALPANPVISCPDLALIHRPADLIALQQQLARHFAEIRIIAYLLRQDRQSLALNRQPLPPGLDPGPQALLPDTANNRRYLDYHARFHFWARVFGSENLHLRPVDRKSAAAIAGDFLSWLGIPAQNISLPAENAAPDRIARLIAHGPFRNKALLHALVAGERAAPGDLPARSEAIACLTAYAESNRRLASELLATNAPTPFSEDFADYPEIASDRWNENKANEHLQGLLQGIASTLGGLGADELRNIAQIIAPRQAPTASKLRRLASRLQGGAAQPQPSAEEDAR